MPVSGGRRLTTLNHCGRSVCDTHDTAAIAKNRLVAVNRHAEMLQSTLPFSFAVIRWRCRVFAKAAAGKHLLSISTHLPNTHLHSGYDGLSAIG